MRNTLRKTWLRAALIAMGTLLGLTLAEAVFILFPSLLPTPVLLEHRWRHPTIKQPDEVYRIRYPPDFDFQVREHPDFSFSIRTRSLGFPRMRFRDDGIDPPVYGVVVGDSHTWGFGVEQEETFTELLEEWTSRDFVNLGRAGDSSVELGRILESYGLALNPRVAIWAFFANDLWESERFDRLIGAITRDNIVARHRENGTEPLRLDERKGFAISAWTRLPRLGLSGCLAHPEELEGRWTFREGDGLRRVTETRPRLSFGAEESFTWTVWLTVEPSVSETRHEIVSMDDEGVGYSLALTPDGRLKAGLVDDAGNKSSRVSEDRIDDGKRHFVAAVFGRERDRLTLWIDGQESGRAYLGTVSGETGNVGRLRLAAADREISFPGRPHEIAFYRAELTGSELRCLLRDGGARWGGTIFSWLGGSRQSLRLSVTRHGRLMVKATDEGAASQVLGDAPLPTETWTHIAASFEPPSVSFFVDGRPAGGGALEAFPHTVPEQAKTRLGLPWPFYGALDEVRIHGAPLSEKQAMALVSSSEPDPTSPPLLAHWPLNDEPCCRVVDRVGLHDGVAYHIRSTAGKSGIGFEFDGLDSRVLFPFLKPGKEPEEEPLHQWLLGGLWLYRLLRFTAGAPEYAPYRARQRSHLYRDRDVSLRIFPPHPRWIDPTQRVTNRVIDEGWQITRDALSRAQELTRHRGVRLVVVVIPFKAQTYWHLVGERHPPEGLEEVDVDWISDLVREFCDSRGIEVVDMTPAFRRRALAGEQLFFQHDSHINAKGHRVIAETLAERLAIDPRE